MRVLATVIWLMTMMATPLAADDAARRALNALRADVGRTTLAYSRKLETVARGHARDMAARGFLSHKGSNGSTLGMRAKRAGYRWCLISENIAKGQASLGQVMQSWRRSKGHYRNMMRRRVTEFAIARHGDVWVMVLGARSC